MRKILTLATGIAFAAVAVYNLTPAPPSRPATQVLSVAEPQLEPTATPTTPAPTKAAPTKAATPAPKKARTVQAAPKPTEYHPEEGKTQDEICVLAGSWSGPMKYQDDADCNKQADICWDLPLRPYEGSTPPPMYAGYDAEHCVKWNGLIMHPPYAEDEPEPASSPGGWRP